MNRISELRKKLGLTQTRLGEEIGVSQQTISKYEKVDENISGDMLQITLKRNASSATAERLFHF